MGSLRTPLFLPHACGLHATVYPASATGSSTRDKSTGLSPADFSGCTSTGTVRPGRILCYQHSVTAGTSRATPDEVNLVCHLCPKSSSGATQLPVYPPSESEADEPSSPAPSSDDDETGVEEVKAPPRRKRPARPAPTPSISDWTGDAISPNLCTSGVRKFRLATVNHRVPLLL